MNKNKIILAIISIVLWSLAVGLREGFTWHGGDMPLIDYHSWRYIEQIGIVLFVLSIANLYKTIFYIGLNWSMVFTIYEPALNFMGSGKLQWFIDSNPYTIMGYSVNQGTKYQILFTVIGLALAFYGYLMDGRKEIFNKQ